MKRIIDLMQAVALLRPLSRLDIDPNEQAPLKVTYWQDASTKRAAGHLAF